MKAKDFMIKDVFVVKPNDKLTDVMKLLVNNKIGGVPVVDENEHLVGMVSDGDILRSINPQKGQIFVTFAFSAYVEPVLLETLLEGLNELSVSSIATKRKIYSVHPESDIDDVIRIFSVHHFKKIPVIDHELKVVGVISRGDVLRHIQRTILEKI